jgi:drug/metabolite transporter (DMT)-like permease
MRRKDLFPVLIAASSAAIGGTATVAARYVAPEASGLTLAVLRYAGAAMIFLALALALGARPWAIARRDWLVVAIFGLSQFALYGWCFAQAFAYVPAARGAVLVATMPILTYLLAVLTGRERWARAPALGVMLGFLGVVLALGDRAGAIHPQAWKGDGLLLVAALASSICNVMVGPTLARYSTLAVTTAATAIGAAALAAVWIGFGAPSETLDLSATGWLALAYLTVFAGAFNFFLWIWALERTSPTRVAITVTVNPIVAALLGALLLGEGFGPRLVASVVFVAAGIALVAWREARPAPEPA